MGALRRLILENQSGRKVRAFRVEEGPLFVIYRHDLRRVEIQANLDSLKEEGIGFDLLNEIPASMTKSLDLAGLGRLRLATENETLDSSRHELAASQDDEDLKVSLKKSGIGHVVAVILLITLSVVMDRFFQKENEPELVTIELPKNSIPEPVTARVQVAEKKLKQTKMKATKNATKTVVKPVTRKVVKASKTETRRAPVVRTAPERSLERVGALAALGGIKTGARSAEGLDSKSLKNIRSAGVGSGGGGVGDSGRGGLRGMMPGKGLIAGSAGGGGRSASAGGYGTRGVGGGKAGYGTISMVGGTSGLSFPMEEETQVEGGLDRDQIAAVINRNRGQIIYCYEQGLQGKPELRGRVSVSFIIGPNGRLKTAEIANSSLGSAKVENCMLSKMRNWQFPKPVGQASVDVLYPFELRRVSSR